MIKVLKAPHREALKEQVKAWLNTQPFQEESQLVAIQPMHFEEGVGVMLRYEER